MTTHPRRIHLIVSSSRVADARTLLGQELRAVAQAVRADADLFSARLALPASPTVEAARGLSSVLTEAQWQALQDVRSRVPLAWRANFFATQGRTDTNPGSPDFWSWAATQGFVPMENPIV